MQFIYEIDAIDLMYAIMNFMHPRNIAKTKEITKTILELVSTSLMTWAVLGSPKSLGKYEKILGATNNFAYWRIRAAMKRLKMQDMVQYDEDDLKAPIRLSEKGMIRLAKYRFQNLFKRYKKWDYFWRMVIFDIPEEKKRLRKRLRRELINIGFYPFQKSALVCPFDCEEVVADLCRIYRLSDYILFCITPSLGTKEKEARKFFFARKKLDQTKVTSKERSL